MSLYTMNSIFLSFIFHAWVDSSDSNHFVIDNVIYIGPQPSSPVKTDVQ